MVDATRDHQQEVRTVERTLTLAAEVRALRGLSCRADLNGAPLADVLLWGLLTRPDDEPVSGMIDGARLALDVLIGYVAGGRFEPDHVEAALYAIGYRLDAVSELLTRVRRGERAERKGGGA